MELKEYVEKAKYKVSIVDKKTNFHNLILDICAVYEDRNTLTVKQQNILIGYVDGIKYKEPKYNSNNKHSDIDYDLVRKIIKEELNIALASLYSMDLNDEIPI